VLARLSKTLSTNVAIAGLTAVALGAGGTTATLAAGHSPTPSSTHASDTAKQKAADQAADKPADAQDEDADETAEDAGTRPTDTHGYCVSQVAKTPLPEGSTVNHGSLVSAAAHACGKAEKTTGAQKSAAKAANGKAYGRSHGTGKPAGVPAR
jgi:hypothetical protein